MKKVVYKGEAITIELEAKNPYEELLLQENAKWLYCKFECLVMATDLMIKANPLCVYQISKILNETSDKLGKLTDLLKEENDKGIDMLEEMREIRK